MLRSRHRLANVFLLAYSVLASAAHAELSVEATLQFELARGDSALAFPSDPLVPWQASGVAPIELVGSGSNFSVLLPAGIVFTPPVTPNGIRAIGIIASNPLQAGLLSNLGIAPGVLHGLGTAAPATGKLPLAGVLTYTRPSSFGRTVPLTTASGATGVGIGGGSIVRVNPPYMGFDVPRISLQGAPWTVGAAALQSQTAVQGPLQNYSRAGFAHGPISGTQSVLAGGVLQLVTPIQVESAFYSSYTRTWGLFGILTLRFVPEPALGLTFGVGALALAMLGRIRSRRDPS